MTHKLTLALIAFSFSNVAHASNFRGSDYILNSETSDQITLNSVGQQRSVALAHYFETADYRYGFTYLHMLAIGTNQTELDLAVQTLTPIAQVFGLPIETERVLMQNYHSYPSTPDEPTLTCSGSEAFLKKMLDGRRGDDVEGDDELMIRADTVYSLSIEGVSPQFEEMGPFLTSECLMAGDMTYFPSSLRELMRIPCP